MDIICVNGLYKLTINEEYTVIAENIMKAKQELLRNFSNDIDRVIDKKLGDYGFDSENINRRKQCFKGRVLQHDEGR